MTTKRTFGLVGDYGDSDSEEEEEEEEVKKAKVNPDPSNEEEETNNVVKARSSVWDGVRKEYEDSSLMYKFITEGEPEEKDETEKTIVDGTLSTEVREAVYKEAYEASLHNVNQRKTLEEQALDREIRAIQSEIHDQRRRWEAVYSSDEEAEGAETVAVVKDMKRRKAVVAAVVEEVSSKKEVVQHKAVSQPELPLQQGERWRRLQMIAESRVKNNPEKYGSNQYPGHKFPLRD